MSRPRPSRWLVEHPRAADALLAAGVALIGVVFHLTLRNDEYAAPSAWGVLLVLVSTVPLAWRRRAPGTVLAAVLAGAFGVEAAEYLSVGWLTVFIAAYSVGAYRSGAAQRWIGGVGTAAVAAFVALGMAAEDVPWQSLVSTTMLFGASIVLGDNMRRRRERAAELVERAERAERERELLANRQVQQERTRIARELHDVVAHSVSVMVIQAGAARRQVAAAPETAIELLEGIEHTGREAMNEMRRILGVLRSDETGVELAPQPSLATLDDLVAAAGDLPVTLHVDGELSGVASAVELSAYRVVQEALTNIRRHAGRVDRVEVNVRRGDERLVVEVTDDGRGASAKSASPGFGIDGMRERVGMFGGELTVGPRSGGGWRVRASFPVGHA